VLALFSHLPAKQPNDSFLNAVIVRFNRPLIPFVSEPQQVLPSKLRFSGGCLCPHQLPFQ
jgi:hypothetical protein